MILTPRDGGPVVLTGAPQSIALPDGTSLATLLYKAATEGPAPTIVTCPGGMGTGMFEIIEWAAARLCAAGFHVLSMNYRGGLPSHDHEDISLAYDWLAGQSFIDAERIGLFGVSRGGNAALRAAAADHRFKAIATFGTVSDFLQQAFGTAAFAPARHRLITGWLGDPVTGRAFYESIQAIDQVQNIVQPLLLLHGEHDMHAPVEQSIMVRDKVLAAGNADVTLELFPVLGHFGEVVPSGFAYDHLASRFIHFFREKLA
ncbi:prolyl oligopeptidase family serine peptidase [Sphingomonas sp. QA11]|uniref:alpha/beta hydrolase family protein n=1 Tax=Sphingomonas sp. QA11 TaxID=2950605 RepID=UPI00234B5BAD|nr:prolyl oligopeptidase family serine peptidase [Sphingomonas sp. QA11]WCM28607.1 prolyl oligopeptidase family serine peptidase [Sphingomonas sp. QA11]